MRVRFKNKFSGILRFTIGSFPFLFNAIYLTVFVEFETCDFTIINVKLQKLFMAGYENRRLILRFLRTYVVNIKNKKISSLGICTHCNNILL